MVQGNTAGRKGRPAALKTLFAIAAAGFILSPQIAHAELVPQRLSNELRTNDPRDAELRSFYAARGFRPLWVDGDRLDPAADALLELVQTADRDGLSRRALRVDDLASRLRRAESGDPESLARAELALSRTLATLVRGTRTQRVSEMTYQNSLLAPVVPTIGAALSTAARAPSLNDYVHDMGWMHPLYAQLRASFDPAVADPSEAELIRLNLDRTRALPVNPAPRYVLIDAAGARLFMYENGKVVDSMKVVVGKVTEQTPMLAGTITNAILNPYWNVPPDLIRGRIAGNVLAHGVSYLRTGGYQVLDGFTDEAKVVDPTTIDWHAVADGTQEIRVRQLPGKANFMGKMKFMFPNALGIYLHDTPDKQLLLESARNFSSGCVRLEDAPRLGRWLYGKPLVAKPKAVEQSIELETPVPVYITYLTAAPENGRIVFRDDVYSRDDARLASLNDSVRPAR
ncbi:L,D-transpeptidase family protein [Novosphingobium tardum]|uniref:L,D-transpeptidase family protein n=1 Tax=Novosphingobium tardum TaxID=1538021 RepID=A0ABV8RMF4_9SPHN